MIYQLLVPSNDVDTDCNLGTTKSPPNIQHATDATTFTDTTSGETKKQRNTPMSFGSNYTIPFYLIISSIENKNIGNLLPI